MLFWKLIDLNKVSETLRHRGCTFSHFRSLALPRVLGRFGENVGRCGLRGAGLFGNERQPWYVLPLSPRKGGIALRNFYFCTAQHGLLRMLSYILQTLSSDRTFGPALNEHLRINIPTKWVVSGNASDFLFVVSMIPPNQVLSRH